MATEYEVQPKHERETGRRVHLRVKSRGEGRGAAGTRTLELKSVPFHARVRIEVRKGNKKKDLRWL